MKLTELLAQREKELVAEITELEKAEATLNEYRHELEVLRKALGVVLDETPLLPSEVQADPIVERNQATGIDVSDLTLLKQDWERKFAAL